MKKLFCSIVLILAAVSFAQDMDSREGDSLALVAIMEANPDFSKNWDTETSISEWSGVTLSFEGRVWQLQLDGCSVDVVPPEIGNLKSLIYLFLANNSIETLPTQIGNLVNLIGISVDNNQLVGLPVEIGKINIFSVVENKNVYYNRN